MIKIENVDTTGWEAAIRGMRNPMNSWDRSDSLNVDDVNLIGDNDKELMTKLIKGGPVHAKFRRMIVVYADITAPLYWWKEYDTYKVGTVANSCSTMHTIHKKNFVWEDFSTEHLSPSGRCVLEELAYHLNKCRADFLKTKNKKCWHEMIQLLPSNFNQKRTVMLNYEVLNNIYHSRKGHKLDEWNAFVKWIESLPNSWIITR